MSKEIPKTAYLSSKIFRKDVDQAPTRVGYGEGLVLAGERDDRVVAICADLTESTQTHLFKQKFPNRFLEVGVGEQSMASVASGMAAMDKIPFFASYAVFSPGRNWEQIRTTICYNNANAKIIGAHSGVSVGPDGGTHQALEDIALTRVIPRMTVIVPADAIEAKKAVLAAAKHKGPVYIRLAREKTPIVTTDKTPFAIGKSLIVWQDQNPLITIFVTGNLLHTTLLVAKELQKEKIPSLVINVPTIKPIDKKIITYAKKTKLVITVEEHQKAGGFGSTILETLASEEDIKTLCIGVSDRFGQSGTPDELLAEYGLDLKGIKGQITLFLDKHLKK